jgi:SAM-dependent MidA family methyltransferase
MTPRESVSILPAPSAEMARHSAVVLEAVRKAIDANDGWLAFDDYLRIVQYAPGLGYYSAGAEKFGVTGDFVTAPEISTLFGRCAARQCAQILMNVGGDILELGAGSGSLAESVLHELHRLGRLPGRYFILEVSADLRDRQLRRLAKLPPLLRDRIQWLDALPQAPISGVILANETADALPFKRFVLEADRPSERGVALSPKAELFESDRPAGAELQAQIELVLRSWPVGRPDGYCSELCPLLGPWVAAMAAALTRGMLLVIDYGCSRRDYYHPQRVQGTMRCHYRHRAHQDALLYPGLQDISAWVDFTRVAEAASEAQLDIAGYTTQAGFLLATGIERDIHAVRDPVSHAKLAAQARLLLLPGEMGENFKVMAATRGLDGQLLGFSFQDLRRTL